MKNITAITAFMSATALSSLTGAAFAQAPTVPQDANGGGLEEIIVTAQRRAESLQDVPVSVTALSSAALANQGVASVSSLQRATPGLNIATFPGDPNTATISLRGLVAPDALPTIDPAVGLYLDGVYIARASGANLKLIDVERVEVLRGPQGTLFGRNTIGGAINIIAKKPTDAFEGSVEGGYGNYDQWQFTGVLNAPLGKNASTRFVYSHSQRKGYAKSSLTGAQLNPDNTEYVRGQIAYRFSDTWDILLSGDYSNTKYRGAQWVTPVSQTGPAALAIIGLLPPVGDSPANYNLPFSNRPPSNANGVYDGTVYGVGGTITGDLGDVTFKAILGYRNLDRTLTGNDLDGTPYNLLLQNFLTDTQHQTSMEYQLLGSAFDNRFDWIVGAYYFTESARNYSSASFLQPLVPTTGITDGSINNDSLSFFGQATFKLTQSLRLTAGVRYVHDGRELISSNRNLTAAGAVASCGSPLGTAPSCQVTIPRAKFNYVPFTVGVDYKPFQDTMVYAKYSRGFRAGGFNLRGSDAFGLTPFGPERLESYEGGVKGEFFDHMLRLNLSVYHSLYDDIQLSGNIPNINSAGQLIGSSAVIQNAGKARINGVEAETTLALGALKLGGTVGVTDHKYTKIGPQVIGVTINSNPILIPKYTASATVDFRLPTSFGHVNLHGDYAYKSRVYFASVPPADPNLQQAGYGLFGAAATVSVDSYGVDFTGWIRNIGNKKYNIRSVDLNALGFLSYFPGDPRTYGITAKYNF